MIDLEKRRESQRRWAKANPEKVKANMRKWQVANKDKQAARNKEWKRKNPEKVKALHEKYRSQNKGYYKRYMRAWCRKRLVEPPPYEPPAHCEACGRSLVKPNLDHCHITNRFRGWLCNPCNAALGLAGDTPDGVRKLLEYIVRAQAMLDLQLLK
jgi:Recombination endonuclease VII